MNDEDKTRQDDELTALESIYEDQFIRSNENDNIGGQLIVDVKLPENFNISYQAPIKKRNNDEQASVQDEKPANEELKIQHLSPIILNFTLPERYPSELPPTYTLSCKWLTVVHLSLLCENLDNVWIKQEPASEVLFTWFQLLSEEVFSILHIKSSLEISLASNIFLEKSPSKGSIDPRAIQDVESIEALVNYLIDYDEKETLRQFEKMYIDCAVCFNQKPGLDCVSFPHCKHVYCKECITDYFTIQIKDGAVRALTCPKYKCDTQADPSLVKSLVCDELFEKYDKFLLQSTLECMSEITYCPRKTCQSPVLQEPELHRCPMGRCPQCNFVFCTLCKRSYHGVESCPVTAKELLKLREEYITANPDRKAALEKRYGRKKLQQAIEEHYSEAWLDVHSKKCPSCQTCIQKIDGCNKMTCYKCRKNFCWLCGKALPMNDPYSHFNDLKNVCYNKLFEGVVMDDDFDENEDGDGWVYLIEQN